MRTSSFKVVPRGERTEPRILIAALIFDWLLYLAIAWMLFGHA